MVQDAEKYKVPVLLPGPGDWHKPADDFEMLKLG
jgi:hypothetical protein